jgi:FtsH-like protein
MERRTQFSIWYFACTVLAVLLLHNMWAGARSTAPIPYSEFQTLVKEGKVADIAITDNQIHGTLKSPVDGKSLAVRDIVASVYRRTLELLHAREALLRESAAKLLERETLGETDLERIRTMAAAPVHPLPKAA